MQLIFEKAFSKILQLKMKKVYIKLKYIVRYHLAVVFISSFSLNFSKQKYVTVN